MWPEELGEWPMTPALPTNMIWSTVLYDSLKLCWWGLRGHHGFTCFGLPMVFFLGTHSSVGTHLVLQPIPCSYRWFFVGRTSRYHLSLPWPGTTTSFGTQGVRIGFQCPWCLWRLGPVTYWSAQDILMMINHYDFMDVLWKLWFQKLSIANVGRVRTEAPWNLLHLSGPIHFCEALVRTWATRQGNVADPSAMEDTQLMNMWDAFVKRWCLFRCWLEKTHGSINFLYYWFCYHSQSPASPHAFGHPFAGNLPGDWKNAWLRRRRACRLQVPYISFVQ